MLPTNPMITLDRRKTKPYTALRFAEVVELVDTSVSKTDALERAGSIPAFGTTKKFPITL